MSFKSEFVSKKAFIGNLHSFFINYIDSMCENFIKFNLVDKFSPSHVVIKYHSLFKDINQVHFLGFCLKTCKLELPSFEDYLLDLLNNQNDIFCPEYVMICFRHKSSYKTLGLAYKPLFEYKDYFFEEISGNHIIFESKSLLSPIPDWIQPVK